VKENSISRLTITEESYIEVIYNLIKNRGYAAVTDIADELKVKPPSVTSMVQRLDEANFVKYTPYRTVTLTSKGKTLARNLEKRHNTLKEFLRMIGVNEKIADEDACRIEHIVHKMTIEKLTEFVESVQETPKGLSLLQHLKHSEKVKSH
jgi:Mn-dependent DtxR family transcriptional regulator